MNGILFAIGCVMLLESLGIRNRQYGYEPFGSMGWSFPIEAPRTIYIFIKTLIK